MNRISKDEYFLKMAETASLRSTCIRARCGSVIIKDGVIISAGYNGSVRGQENCCDRGTCPRIDSEPDKDKHLCVACHSEANAIVNVARVGSVSTVDSTLFVYFVRLDNKMNTYRTPCSECMKLIINAGIKYIINYTEDNEKICLDVSEIENGVVTTERVKEIKK